MKIFPCGAKTKVQPRASAPNRDTLPPQETSHPTTVCNTVRTARSGNMGGKGTGALVATCLRPQRHPSDGDSKKFGVPAPAGQVP